MKITTLLFILLFSATWVFAEAGYKRTPWGSKKWTGPGRPPHWSQPAEPSHFDKRSPGHHRSKKSYKNGYKYHSHDKRKKYRRHSSTVVVKEVVKPVEIRKETVEKTRYVPVTFRRNTSKCGGDTVYTRNKKTGEITIHYISPPKNC